MRTEKKKVVVVFAAVLLSTLCALKCRTVDDAPPSAGGRAQLSTAPIAAEHGKKKRERRSGREGEQKRFATIPLALFSPRVELERDSEDQREKKVFFFRLLAFSLFFF